MTMKVVFHLVFALVVLAVLVKYSSAYPPGYFTSGPTTTTARPTFRTPPDWGTLRTRKVYIGVYEDMSFIKVNATTGKNYGGLCPHDPTIAIWSILTNYRPYFVCTAMVTGFEKWINYPKFWETREFADYMTEMRHSGITCGYSKYQRGGQHRFRRGPDVNNICLFDQDCNKHCRYDPPELASDPPHETNRCGIGSAGSAGGLCEGSGEYALGAMIMSNTIYGCNIRWHENNYFSDQKEWDDALISTAFSIPYTEVRCCYPTDGRRIAWRGSHKEPDWVRWELNCTLTCNYSDYEPC